MYEEEKHLHVLSFYKKVHFFFGRIIFETPCIIWTLDTLYDSSYICFCTKRYRYWKS